jgi:hypothetical protein
MEDVPIDKRQSTGTSLISHGLIALCCSEGRMLDKGFIDGVDSGDERVR